MSFTDEYLKLKKKREEEETEKLKAQVGGNSFSDEYSGLRAKRVVNESDDDIAPVVTTTKKEEEEERTWFKSGALDDGVSLLNIGKTILGTVGDAGVGVLKGISRMGEGVGDLLSYGVAAANDAVGLDEYADEIRKRASESVTDRLFGGIEKTVDKYSVLGEKSDSISEGIGQVATIIATGGLAGAAGLGTVGATALTTGLMGASSAGSGIGEAYLGGATDEEAATYGLIKGVVDAGSELIFGGLGKTVKALGISKGLSSLDDMFAQKLTSRITNQVAKNFVEYGVKASAEGVEEVLAGIGSAVGKKLTYMEEKELRELIEDENLMEQFVAGAVTSGIAQSGIVPGMKSGSLVESIETGRDFVSGLSQNEQKVVEKEVEKRVAEAEKDGEKLSNKRKNEIYEAVLSDMEKGYISTDTIEEVLGGETYKAYRDTIDSEDALQQEFDTLNKMKQGEMTGEQLDRRTDLKKQLEEIKTADKRTQMKSRLGEEVFGLVRGDRLAESYNERGRRSQAFQADLTQYDARQQETVKKAIESGILNNTNRTHEFVDMIAKISADKGVLFDFTNNEKLKGSVFAVDGKTVNGFVTRDGVTLNIDSAKSLNSVVGHEITHVLEGTELYTALQSAIVEYAKSKGDYQGRYDSLTELYKGVEGANVDAELTADLVGDYLFTDPDFIHNLSTNHRNVFQKVYDEIKYLCKVATAGSKEARELEKVKRAFEKAYQSESKSQEDAKYSLGYHAGDLGKAESYHQQGYSRGTGHFGTGTYFVGDEAQINYGDYAKRPHHAVEFDNYNLYKIRNDKDGYALHDQLKVIDGGFSQEFLDAAKEDKHRISELRRTAWERAEGYDTKVWDEELEMELSEDYIGSSIRAFLEVAQENGLEAKTYDEWLAEQSPDDDPKPGDSDYDYYRSDYYEYLKETLETADKDGNTGYSEFRDAYFDLWLRFGKDRVNRALQEVVDYNATMEETDWATQQKSDSLATVFMKSLGYEGIDARGSGLDNTTYGSVIYDLKGDDLAKKKAIGTAKYSLSDSDGKQLTAEQQDYFKDSKMRDENGNLKVMYHGSQDAGFHVFDARMSDDDTSFFFVDRNDVAASYSGTTETYEARTIRTAEDMNNFLAEIGYDQYTAVEKDGKFELLENNEHVAWSDTAQGIYEEFCWYEGVGEGDANYKVYLNLKNPLVVDAQGRNWHKAGNEFSQEKYDKLSSLTDGEKEALRDLAGWEDFGIFNSELKQALLRTQKASADGSVVDDYTQDLATAFRKGGFDGNVLFDLVNADFTEEALRENAVDWLKTRDYAQKAKAEGYDGVIFKNIVDVGGYGNGSEGAATVAIAFDSNQIKSVANAKPTADADIRYSLTEYTEEEKKAHNKAVVDYFGKTYSWKETGYVLLDGTKLDLSGKHEGAPGGYRTVDHRDIVDALGDDYGDGSYSGSLVQFMSEGNIRISPESNGINLSVQPTKAQERSLADFISRFRGEVILDIDDANGYTVVSVEYPYGTHFSKVLGDIRGWFENGTKPEVPNTSPYLSLSSKDEAPVRRSSFDTYGKDIRLETQEETQVESEEVLTSAPESEVAVVENATTTENRLSELGEQRDRILDRAMELDKKKGRTEAETAEMERLYRQADAIMREIETGVETMFPEDAPIQTEIARLEAEKAEVESKLATDIENADLNNRWFEIQDRIEALRAEEDAEQTDRLASLDDADAPPEMEAPITEDAPFEDGQAVDVKDPFADRDVPYGNEGKKVNAYMYDNPEVKPFFQAEALALMEELNNGTKGERWYNDHLYYESGGEQGYGGTKRHQSESIDRLSYEFNLSYEEIEKGLEAIIQDNGAENIAAAKKIEFVINDRLMKGYKPFGPNLPPDAGRPNQDYIALMQDKQRVDSLTDATPPVEEITEDIAPVMPVKKPAEPAEPVREQQTEKVAQIRKAEPEKENWRSRAKRRISDIISMTGDKGWVFENLGKKTGNREVEAKYDFMKNRVKGQAQEYLREHLLPIYEKIRATGKTEDFDLYAYHLHNVDRMSLETEAERVRREEIRKQLDGYTEKQIESIASEMITRNTPQDRVKQIYLAQEYIDLGGAKGKNKPVYGSSVTADVSRKKVAEYEAANPEFKELAQEVLDFNKGLREFAVREGLITQKVADKWAKMYPHYVPIRRTDRQGAAVSVPLDSNRTGVNNPFKRATGGNSDFIPLMDAMAMNTEQIFYAVARNDFGRELMGALETSAAMDAEKSVDAATRQAINAGGLEPGTRVKAHDRDNIGTIKAFNPGSGTYRVHFENQQGHSATVNLDANILSPLYTRQTAGKVVDASDILESTEANDNAVLEPGKNGQPPQFTVFVKGKPVTFDITEEMFKAMKPAEGILSQTYAVPNAIASGYKKVLTEYDPFFALFRNPIKDSKDVLFNSQHAAATYAAAPKTMKQIATKGDYYTEFVRNGGKSQTYYDTKEMAFTDNKKTNPYRKAADNFEMFWRLSEYIASREAGRSEKVAMLDAARVTTNFGAGGDFTKWLNRNGALFLNPSVQGVMQIGRNVREAYHDGLKGSAILAAKVIATGMGGMFFNWLLWDDDEEYEELSDYVKQNYFCVWKTEDGKFIRIPKGRMEAVIQNGFEQMQSLVTGDGEADLSTFAELVANNIAPNNPLENNILSPLIQAATNKTWYGDDLVPTRLQKLPAAEQYDESTDSISKWVGDTFDISPYKVNYAAKQYGGGFADLVLPMFTEEAEGDTFLAPIKDQFVSDPVLKNQNVSDFYDKVDELAVNANGSKATDKDILMSKYMNSVSGEIGKLYGEKREIQSSDMSDAEKYNAVREIQNQINNLAKDSLNGYQEITYEDDYREGGEYARVQDRIFKKDKNGEWQKLSDEQVTKYEVTRAAGDAAYASDGENHYRWYVPGEDSTAEPGWRKLTDEQFEKQEEVTNGLGISPSDYWSKKEEYDFAYEKPEKYAVAKSVGGYDAYKGYSSELYDIKGEDKDGDGRSDTGTRKEKVIEWMNNLDADYGTKIILFKNEYNADDTYNYDIIDYLNSRADISYKEMETILKELGFEVSSDGTISW